MIEYLDPDNSSIFATISVHCHGAKERKRERKTKT